MTQRRCWTCESLKPVCEFSTVNAKRCDGCKADPPRRRYVEPDRACYHCHEVKPAEAFAWSDGAQGSGRARCRRRICLDCQARETAAREQHRAAWRATWIQDGRTVRRCSACRKVKDLERDFYSNGPQRRLYRCKPCQVAHVADRTSAVRADPVQRPVFLARRAAWQRAWRAANPEKQTEYDRRFRERLLADAKRHARALETERMARHLRNERKSGEPLSGPARSGPLGPVPSDDLPRLPAGPLASAIDDFALHAGDTLDAVCQGLGIDPGQARAWRRGAIEEINFDTADRVLTALGVGWWEVYAGEHYEQAARAFVGETELVAA